MDHVSTILYQQGRNLWQTNFNFRTISHFPSSIFSIERASVVLFITEWQIQPGLLQNYPAERTSSPLARDYVWKWKKKRGHLKLDNVGGSVLWKNWPCIEKIAQVLKFSLKISIKNLVRATESSETPFNWLGDSLRCSKVIIGQCWYIIRGIKQKK